MSLAQTKRANELEKDMNAWEENRLLTSGVVRMKEVSLTGEDLIHSTGWERTELVLDADFLTHASCDQL